MLVTSVVKEPSTTVVVGMVVVVVVMEGEGRREGGMTLGTEGGMHDK